MFKIYRLKRQLIKAKKLKVQEAKNQNFETAVSHFEKEEQILQEISNLRQKRKVKTIVESLLNLHHSYYLAGIYLQEKKTNLPIYLQGYIFSRELNFYLQTFFSEYPAFRFSWEDNLIQKRLLIREATEYFFITTILDHFTRWGCNSDNKNCKHEIIRNNTDDLIKSNRLLNKFSTPIQQRKGFSEKDKLSDKRIIVVRDESDNLIRYYEKFHYKFPYKCNISREGNDIVFRTPFMSLRFHILYRGGKERLPKDFCRLYLGFLADTAPRVDVFIDVYIKWAAFILPKYWKYGKTIRSLKKQLHESFSIKQYTDSLNWQSIYVQSRIMENLLAKK